MSKLTFTGLYKSFAKYGGGEVTLDDVQVRDLMTAIDWAELEFGPYLSQGSRLTAEEVVERVDMSRSPGFPWAGVYKDSSEAYLAHKEWFDSYVEGVLNGTRTPIDPIFKVFGKEEVLPTEKIKVGKLRGISGCPLEFKLLVNAVLLDQNESFYSAHGKTMSEVGINPFNLGWDALYRKLHVNGWRGMALDVSAFDASFSWVLAKAVALLRARRMIWLSEAETNRILPYITSSIFRAMSILPNGEVVQREHGNASGSPNTVVDNTLALAIAFMYTWIRSARTDGCETSYQEFKSNVKAALYGDDNTFTASPLGQERLSESRVSEGFAELGWKVTQETEGWVETSDLTFLQRGFKKFRGHWVPVCVDGVKGLDSLLHKSKGDIVKTYQRAASLLLTYYWNSDARGVIEGFLNWLEREYFPTDSADHVLVRSNRLTSAQIKRLYIDPSWLPKVVELD